MIESFFNISLDVQSFLYKLSSYTKSQPNHSPFPTMALCNSKLSTHFHVQQSQPILSLNFISWLTIFLFLLFPFANSISFNFSSFNPNQPEIQFLGDAIMQPYHGNDGSSEEMLQLTKYPLDGTLPTSSVGRATYSTPIHLWDPKTGSLADFNTHFSFIIAPWDPNSPVGDGLSFFLSPQTATIPSNSTGGFLGLFNNSNTDTNNQIVAVEFDTYQNSWDPSPNHIGIDVNSIESVAYVTPDTSMANTKIANAWVDYNSTTKTLSVYLTYELNPVFQGNYDLSHVVDLSNVLPEWVSVGFSGATGSEIQVNSLISWSFDSTLGGSSDSPSVGSPSNSTSGGSPSDSTLGGSPSTITGHKTNQLVIYLPVGIGSLICGVGLFWFLKLTKIVLPWQSSSQEVKQIKDGSSGAYDQASPKAPQGSSFANYGIEAGSDQMVEKKDMMERRGSDQMVEEKEVTEQRGSEQMVEEKEVMGRRGSEQMVEEAVVTERKGSHAPVQTNNSGFILGGLGATIAQGLGFGIGSIVDDVTHKAGTAVDAVAQRAMDDVAQRAGSVVNDVAQRAGSGIDAVAQKTVDDVAQRAGSVVNAMAQKVGSVVDVVAQRTVDDVTHKAGSVVDVVTHRAGSVVDVVTHRAGSATDDVTQRAGSVVDTVTQGAGSAVDAVTQRAGSVVDHVTHKAVDDVAHRAGSVIDVVAHRADAVPQRVVDAAMGPRPI